MEASKPTNLWRLQKYILRAMLQFYFLLNGTIKTVALALYRRIFEIMKMN